MILRTIKATDKTNTNINDNAKIKQVQPKTKKLITNLNTIQVSACTEIVIKRSNTKENLLIILYGLLLSFDYILLLLFIILFVFV